MWDRLQIRDQTDSLAVQGGFLTIGDHREILNINIYSFSMFFFFFFFYWYLAIILSSVFLCIRSCLLLRETRACLKYVFFIDIYIFLQFLFV